MHFNKQLNDALKDPNSFTATILIILPCLLIFFYALYKGLSLSVTLIIAVMFFFIIKTGWQRSIYTNKAISKKFKTRGYKDLKKIKTPKPKYYFINVFIGLIVGLFLLFIMFQRLDKDALLQSNLFSPFNIFIFLIVAFLGIWFLAWAIRETRNT